MKRMHKWLLAMLLVMAVLLAGCGEKEENISGTVTPIESQSATVPTGTVEAATEAAEEENAMALGLIEGGVYTNTYAGFGCELDSNWLYYSAEELQELPANVEELIENSELGEAVADATQIFDMKAENVNDLTTMNVLFTKLGLQERLAYAMLSEEQIMDAVLDQADAVAEAYAQAGFEVSAIEKVKVEFLGEEHWAIRTVTTTQDVPYYILQVYDYHAGQFGITLTVSSYFEDKTADLLSLFYAVE